MEVNQREISLEILEKVLEEGAFSHIVLDRTLEKYAYLDKQQRSFITRLVNGTAERMLTLDYAIDCFSKTKVKKMKPVIRTLLRMSAYQILYMDSVPDSAACNEAVKLAKRRGFGSLSGFVNGVLRTLSREKEGLTWPNLSVEYSMPNWICQRLISQLGEEKTREALQAFSAESPITIVVNTAKTDLVSFRTQLEEAGVRSEFVEGNDRALRLYDFDRISAIPGFEEGKFWVEDLSSQQVPLRAGIRPGDRVLDVCAAPGGKSMYAALLTGPNGRVSAFDISEKKTERIRENVSRCGFENLEVSVKDATLRDETLVDSADLVIADCPCSGLGVLGKKPEIRYRLQESDLKDLSTIQLQILNNVCAYVKPGGTLMYSTCTINSGENEKNVSRFLKAHPGFTLLEQEQLLPDASGQDGFFLAKMQKA